MAGPLHERMARSGLSDCRADRVPQAVCIEIRFVSYTHESAYVLAKGQPALPCNPPADVMDWTYTGNRLHPTQKPVSILKPLIEAFCPEGGIVLDPFCGSGSTLVAACHANCDYLGIELDQTYHRIAARRLAA